MIFLYRVDGETVRLMLWDTAGQEEFDSITKAYYRGNLILYLTTIKMCVLLYNPNLLATGSLRIEIKYLT